MFTPFPQNREPDTDNAPPWFQMPPPVVAALFFTWLEETEPVPAALYQPPPEPTDSFDSSSHPNNANWPDV
jgi:hypothetical protein